MITTSHHISLGYRQPQFEISRVGDRRIRVSSGCSSTTLDSTGAAIAYIRETIARIKRDIGRDAARKAWDGLCSEQAAQAKQVRTARQLLAEPRTRRLVAVAEAANKSWTKDLDYYATRNVQRVAAAILAARAQRRADRVVANQPVESGRILAMATPAAIASRIPDPAAKHTKTWLKRQLLRDDVRSAMSDDAFWSAVDQVSFGRRQMIALIQRDLQKGSKSESLVRRLVAAIGTTDDQTEADMESFDCDSSFSGKQGRNHMLEETSVYRIEARKDLSAALVTMADYKSWGSSSYGNGYDSHYGSRRAMSFRCYLVVRDSTRGSAHVLRVPPRFGNERTKFFGTFASAGERIQAAIAWTFDQNPGEYRPDVES